MEYCVDLLRERRGNHMSNWLIPDFIFPTYRDVTVDFLKKQGIKALLIDIDNTLAPYEMPEPDNYIREWFKTLAANGIKATLVSNNDRERVELFNATLGLPAYYKSGKPFAKNLKKAMHDMGTVKSDTAMLGDQLLTDVLAGKGLGLLSFTVPPIRDKRDLFTRFKRLLERPVFRAYHKKIKKIEQEVKNHADT